MQTAVRKARLTHADVHVVFPAALTPTAVSYTHLDVYKRQVLSLGTHVEKMGC